jgi:hypothetical protein
LVGTSDDSQTFSPDLGSAMQFLSCVKIDPTGRLHWSESDNNGFWFRSHVVITLLSLATIPQYHSYCTFGKAQLREILYVQPQKRFGTALELEKIGVHPTANHILQMVKRIRSSLAQTAQHHLSHSTWGKNMALIYRIAFQVAQYGPRIKSLDSVEALLSSIYVYENGEIDYGEVEVVDPESGMTPQKVQAYVRQLLGKELYMPVTYRSALLSLDISGFKRSMDQDEGRSVFEIMLCSFALLYSRSHILDGEENESMKTFKRIMELATASSFICVDPDVLKLMNRLASLPVEGAVDDNITSLVGTIIVLVFKAKARGDWN